MTELDEKQLQVEYDKRFKKYSALGEIIQVRLESVLSESEVDFDSVPMRIKTFSSFFEKTFRREVIDPFREIKDICGLRIIHLFEEDLPQIRELVIKEFHMVDEANLTFQNQDPEKHREKAFSYRSYHMIVSLRGKLLKEYPEMANVIAEIQIRTICMHAWASIEHKLNYKKQNDFPQSFRPVINRKFSQMSAMLEVADEFFVSLRTEKRRVLSEYKAALSNPRGPKKKLLADDLNIDLLQAYLESNYLQFRLESNRLKYLLDEMRSSNTTIRDIELGEKILKEHGLFKTIIDNYPTQSGSPTRSGLARLILDTTNEDFYNLRAGKPLIHSWKKFVNSIKAQL